MSCSFPRKANAEVRAVTLSPGMWVSALMISSARPSLKYSFSLSALIFANGKTAIDGSRREGFIATWSKCGYQLGHCLETLARLFGATPLNDAFQPGRGLKRLWMAAQYCT